MKFFLLLTLILTVCIFLCPVPSDAALIFGPYLLSAGPDKTMVCAFVDENDNVTVEDLDAEGGPRTLKAQGHKPACATLDGLAPDKQYRYAMLVNGKKITTDPPPAFVADSKNDLTFVVYGDTRAGDDSFDLSHQQVVRAIVETTVPEAVIHTGDFVEVGDNLSLWANFFNIEKDLLATTPIFPAIGQSDQPPETMRRIFPLLNSAPYYSFDRGMAHFSVLNIWHANSQSKKEKSADSPQATWLRNDLATAKQRGAKYLFVVVHDPVIDVDGEINSAMKDVFMPIFSTYGVTAVFSGAHFFSHAIKDSVHYFTNGGGGANLESRRPDPKAFLYTSAVHHFLVLEVGRAGARGRAVNAHGDDFYSVDFDEKPTGNPMDEAPTYVKSYGNGAASVALTVYFNPGCSDCENFSTATLPALADAKQASIVATFRSLADPDNKASLATVSDQTGPTPIVSIGPEVFVGQDEIEAGLPDAVDSMLRNKTEKKMPVEQLILIGAVTLAGIILLVSILILRKKRR